MTTATKERSLTRNPFALSEDRERYLVLACLVYAWTGILMGFGPGAIEMLSGTGTARPLRLHVHAVAFYGWMILLTVQFALVHNRLTSVHRRLGRLGAGLALAMIVVGLWTALASIPGRIERGANPGFLIVPLIDMVLFGLLVTAAVSKRNQAASHKRLILLATFQLTGAGFGRWMGPVLYPLLDPYGFVGAWLGLYGLLMLGAVSIGIFDLLVRRRLHPDYTKALGMMLAGQAIAILLLENDGWKDLVVRVAG